MSSTAYAKYHSTSLSSQLENVYFLYGVILNRKQSASDCGSSWIWIPACAGMTRLESFASNGNDTPFVILNRKQSASDWGSIRTGFPFSRE